VLRRAIAEIKQSWSVIRWVTKNVLSRTPPCFGRHVKPLVPAAFAVVSTHQPALGPCGGLWPVLHKTNPLGRPVPHQWGHNRLMMISMYLPCYIIIYLYFNFIPKTHKSLKSGSYLDLKIEDVS
jgi:hypothetical protein